MKKPKLTDQEATLLYRAAYCGTQSYPVRRSRSGRGFVHEPTGKAYQSRKLAIYAHERWLASTHLRWLEVKATHPYAILTATGVRLGTQGVLL